MKSGFGLDLEIPCIYFYAKLEGNEEAEEWKNLWGECGCVLHTHTHTHNLLDDLVCFRTLVDSEEGILILLWAGNQTKTYTSLDAVNHGTYKDLLMQNALLSNCISCGALQVAQW